MCAGPEILKITGEAGQWDAGPVRRAGRSDPSGRDQSLAVGRTTGCSRGPVGKEGSRWQSALMPHALAVLPDLAVPELGLLLLRYC
jgi:hypothetical protein